MRRRTRTTLCYVVVLLAEAAGRGPSALLAAQPSKPLAISNFRTPSLEHLDDQFAWGGNSVLFYVHRHPSGPFIYLLNLSTNQSELITKGTSPAFRCCTTFPGIQGSMDSLYFLRDLGYSIEKEFWRYDHFLATAVQGEHKDSSATLMIASDIFLSPTDDRSLVYRYSCSMAEGGFKQIRITRVKPYGDPAYQTAVLYSRDLGDGETPSVSGWVNEDTVICFIGDEPYSLKVNFGRMTGSAMAGANLRHYPDDKSGNLIRGLGGRNEVELPASNFAPDGKSYLVYSSQKHAIIQKHLDGTEVRSTELPAGVRYDDIEPVLPKFSRDGRHIAFIGRLDDGRTVYVADVN